jgi:hypothetical protein
VIHPVVSLEAERATHMRDLLDARSSALNEHGLDMRTELRPGEVTEELQRELAVHEDSMLVLGTSNPETLPWDWLAYVLGSSPARPVLIVNSARVDVPVEA